MTPSRFRQILDRLQASFWFTPLVMSVVAVVLAEVLLRVDALIPNSALNSSRFVYNGSVSETRTALLGIAGTVLATAGVVYSLLTLPLSVAASQFGSRLLRLYMRDRTIQVVLGMFFGTFVFCLSVVLSIPYGTQDQDTPQLAASAALYLSLATFASLIALIHHISTSLEAPNLIAAASAELQSVVRSLPTLDARAPLADRQAQITALENTEGQPIYARHLGYVQSIDAEAIRSLVEQHDLVIRFLRKPGHFIHPDELIAMAWPAKNVNETVALDIRGCYQLGNLRTPVQDVEYAVNQLVEIALRAMSPAINDPFTAMTCLCHLGAGLALRVARGERAPYLLDSKGRPCLFFNQLTFPELLDAAYNMLRHASRENADVLICMADSLDTIAQQSTLPEQRAALAQHTRLLEAECAASDLIEWDKQRVSQRCAELLAKLDDLSGHQIEGARQTGAGSH
jgi:uncharacterized membrane protein